MHAPRAVVAIAFAVACGACARSTVAEAPMMRLAVVAPAGALPPLIAEVLTPVAPPPKPVEWAEALEPVQVKNVNTGAEASVGLYRPDGTLDDDAVAEFVATAGNVGKPAPLATRVIQLAIKAAYHFHAQSLVVVSAYRPLRRGRGGYHAKGEALDFQLPGVDYRKLASYLRSFPRAGVGVYTNPRTHFVHLDVRDRSYHWLDASPPGVTWQEAMMRDPGQAERDASYRPESDLPLE